MSDAKACPRALLERLLREGVVSEEQAALVLHGDQARAVVLWGISRDELDALEQRVRRSRAYRAHPAQLEQGLLDGWCCS